MYLTPLLFSCVVSNRVAPKLFRNTVLTWPTDSVKCITACDSTIHRFIINFLILAYCDIFLVIF